MNIKEIFEQNKNNLLFSKNPEILKLRENTLKKFDDEYFNRKKNENIKFLDINSLNKLNYFYQNNKILSSINVKNENLTQSFRFI